MVPKAGSLHLHGRRTPTVRKLFSLKGLAIPILLIAALDTASITAFWPWLHSIAPKSWGMWVRFPLIDLPPIVLLVLLVVLVNGWTSRCGFSESARRMGLTFFGSRQLLVGGLLAAFSIGLTYIGFWLAGKDWRFGSGFFYYFLRVFFMTAVAE